MRKICAWCNRKFNQKIRIILALIAGYIFQLELIYTYQKRRGQTPKEQETINISGERERELLINEIESLKQEQKKRSLQVVDLEHTNERFQALWGMVAEKGKLTEFDGDMFRKIVNRVTVDGKELTYDFGCGITITDSIE